MSEQDKPPNEVQPVIRWFQRPLDKSSRSYLLEMLFFLAMMLSTSWWETCLILLAMWIVALNIILRTEPTIHWRWVAKLPLCVFAAFVVWVLGAKTLREQWHQAYPPAPSSIIAQATLSAPAPASPRSPLVLESSALHLFSDQQLKQANGEILPAGTYALFVARITNTGKPNSAVDWTCRATTKTGAAFDGEGVELGGPMEFPLPDSGGVSHTHAFWPADDLREKASTVAEGKWIEGFVIFFFKGVAKDILHQPGTVFLFKCKDGLNKSEATYEQIWKGQDDPWMFFPGMNNTPLD